MLSCLLSSQRVPCEAQAPALCLERCSSGKAGIPRVPFCLREALTQSLENWKRSSGGSLLVLSEPAVCAAASSARCSAWGRGKGASLFAYRGTSELCCHLHAESFANRLYRWGAEMCFFRTLSRFTVWFPVRSLHFPSLPLPASDTLFLTFCVALCAFRHQCTGFLHSQLSLNSWCFRGQGVFCSLCFIYF